MTVWNAMTSMKTKALARRVQLGLLDRRGEHISEAAFSLDYARRARFDFQLAAESQDLNVDATIEEALVRACRVEEIPAAERSPGRI